MAKIKSSKRGGRAPDGFDKVEPTLVKLQGKLKDVQSENKTNSTFKIMQINHQISRYVYSMYYERKLIDKPLYDWLLKQKYVNANLIAKWKKQGYEKLCCLNCIKKDDNNFGTSCICRVPKQDLDKDIECVKCGCKGCASTD